MAFRGFVTYLDLYVALCNHNDLRDFTYLFDTLKSNSDLQLCGDVEKELKAWCRRFCSRVFTKWSQSNRKPDIFRKKNSDWLSSNIQWPEALKENVVSSIDLVEEVISPSKSDASTSTARVQRKSFEDLSNRQKRRRTEEVRTSCSEDELLYSTECALKSSGRSDVAAVMAYLLKNPQEVSKVMNVIQGQSTSSREISPQKALALYVSMQLSKWRYSVLRNFNEKEGLKYPTYYQLLKEKNNCYPKKEDVTVTETSVKIRLQSLLDLTVKRLIISLGDKCNTEEQLVLHSKWGFDGASSQSVYHQKSSACDSELNTIFMASIVPLKLTNTSGDTIWQNERPSSTAFCRPWSFKFMQETESNVKIEMAAFETEIAELTPTSYENTTISHNLLLTMIDGKIHSFISGTSSAVCDLCKSRPVEMNNLQVVRDKPVNEDMFKHGLSSLHAWIRSMECLLHIAYKIDVKSWQLKGDDMKEKVKDKKASIQEAFRRETGLLLDVVKQGSGNTNTGNTARRFFADPETTARLTGLDVNLIRKIAVILQCISSGEKINMEKFKLYCDETADLYVQLYSWYYMPASLHKLLIHGWQIAEHLSIVPIGFLSEEASEARNKDFRKYRESHSRKRSSLATNEDILHNLLLSSDPLITSLRPTMNKKSKISSFKELEDLLLHEKNDYEFVDVSSILEDDSSDDDYDLDIVEDVDLHDKSS